MNTFLHSLKVFLIDGKILLTTTNTSDLLTTLNQFTAESTISCQPAYVILTKTKCLSIEKSYRQKKFFFFDKI